MTPEYRRHGMCILILILKSRAKLDVYAIQTRQTNLRTTFYIRLLR